MFLILLLAFCVRITDAQAFPCNKDALRFSGLQKTGTLLFRHGEGFAPTCQRGYKAQVPNGKLICANGAWTGHFPPCVAANCMQPPPTIPNGKTKTTSGLHFSFVAYECDEFYFITGPSKVQCLFGEWTGSLPVCKNSRCSYRDLKNVSGIVSVKSETSSGAHLDYTCEDGFVAADFKPLCANGVWVEQDSSPCKEAGCIVKEISNGAMVEMETHKLWRWSKLRRQQKEVPVKVKIGRMKPAGHSLQVQCNFNYSFQDTIYSNGTIYCVKGNWHPQPNCSVRS